MLHSNKDCFGGQGHYDFDNDMGYFAKLSEEKIRLEIIDVLNGLGQDINNVNIDRLVRERLEEEIAQSMQTVVYNLNSMHSRAGSQIPFSSVNIGMPTDWYSAKVCEHFLKEYDKGLGKGEQAIFPNVIFRVKKDFNLNPGDPYYYLFQLACRVASNRANPTFLNIDASHNIDIYNQGFLPATMGCRTKIGLDINGDANPAKRGNIAPVSINLPGIALKVKDKENRIEYFLAELLETLDLCEKQLLHRYSVLKNLKGKDLPFIAGEKMILGSEEIGPEDSIEPILKHGTFGIGFIGLAETLTCLVGSHHGETNEAIELGMIIIKTIRTFTDNSRNKHKLNFTCYATPKQNWAFTS